MGHVMQHSQGGDFMFCDLCGTMLSLISANCAKCPLCKFQKSAKEISGKEICYKVSAELMEAVINDIRIPNGPIMHDRDMRRDLGISHFEGKIEVKDMEINKKCERCSNTKLRFYSRQMRSADEGQTTFFHCPVCSYKFSEN